MKLTKVQIDNLNAQLSGPFSAPINLDCDGRRITLEVRCWKPMVYRVCMFIDGFFKGAWISSSNEHPEQKFLRKSTRHLYSPAKKKDLQKTFGKRRAEEYFDLSRTFTKYHHDWPSAKAALQHLNKVCDSVVLVEEPR